MTESTIRKVGGREAFTTNGAAEYVGGFNPGTLRWWRHIGTGPKSFTLGRRRVMYYRDDLDAWLAEQAVETPRSA